MTRTRRTMARWAAALTVAAASPIAAAPATAAPTGSSRPPAYRTVWDDFRRGFTTSGPDARWSLFAAGPYVGDDGIVRTSTQGLRVTSSGTNPATGEPAFVRTLGQEPGNGTGIPGTLDHVKWLALPNHTASTGLAGFDAVPGRTLSCETTFGGRTFGTAGHPFGAEVTDPEDDLRLAVPVFNLIDPETFVALEFAVTNRTVYVFYERLPNARATLGDYSSFLYAIPVARIRRGQELRMKVSYNRSAGTAQWQLDGRTVFAIGDVGKRLPTRAGLVADHGGTDAAVTLRQLNCGMGLFSVLDGASPGRSGAGLARLSTAPDFYFDPVAGPPAPQRFADDESRPASRLFGQGAELTMRNLVVSSS
jgi:hypothetical protein